MKTKSITEHLQFVKLNLIKDLTCEMLYCDAFSQQENTTGCYITCSYKHFDSKINKLPIHYHKHRSHASEYDWSYGAFDKIKYSFLNDLSFD